MPATAKARRTLRLLMAERGLHRVRDLSLATGIQAGQLGHIARGHVPTEVGPIQAIAKALAAKPHDVLSAIVESSHDAADEIRAELAS
jgi:DNA-binding Xre family transcriptional regulator